jgi:hypothetical protein
MAYNANGSVFSEFRNQFNNVEENAANIGSGMGNLADAHLELLDEEVSIQKERSVSAIALLGTGAVAAIVGAIFGSFALAQFLAERLDSVSMSGGFAIVGGLWLIAAPVFITLGMNAFKKISLLPSATISSLQESIKCLRN